MDTASCSQIKKLGNRIMHIFNKKTNNNIQISLDLANWMGNLDGIKRNTPLILLAIPGSHDSMTYGITRTSQIAPDAEPIVKELDKYLKPFVSLIMYSWSVTQGADVKTQLDLGIRYLDLRIATKKNDSHLYFVHGMYGGEVSSGLSEINNFINEHKKEVVILDFQHFYDMNISDHDYLIDLLKTIFGDKLCPQPDDILSITLNSLLEQGYQVIVIYRNSNPQQIPYLWNSNKWPTPWPDTMKVSYLLQFLDNHLANKPQHVGYVSQCVLTPQRSTVIVNPLSGVMRKCAKPASKVIIPWIQDKSPPLNVAIADFIEMNNGNFPLSVISLNYS